MAYYSTGAPAYATPWWMMNQEGPTPQSEMPTGQMVRDPSTMGTDALQHELMALQSPYGRYGGRVPAVFAGGAAGLGGVPGLGFLLGGMASAGMRNRMGTLGRENTQRQIAQQYPPAQGVPSFRPPPVVQRPPPVGFMGGRNAGGGYSGGRSDADMAQPGLGNWSDETGFGGA